MASERFTQRSSWLDIPRLYKVVVTASTLKCNN